MKVQNLTSTHSDREIPNQFVIFGDNKITFQSYQSEIAVWDTETRELFLVGEMWDYSNTTRKYFSQFLRKYTPFSYVTKGHFKALILDNPSIKHKEVIE